MRNHLLRKFLFLGSVLCPAITAMHADTVSAFNFNATFVNGATGTGLVNIDVTTGMVTAFNIGVMGTNGSTSFTGPFVQASSGSYYTVGFGVFDSEIVLVFPQSSLVGYPGGQLCSTSLACPSGVYTDTVYARPLDGNVNASVGMLTPDIPVSAPEIDPSLAYGAMEMLFGSAAVLRGRKRTLVGAAPEVAGSRRRLGGAVFGGG